MGGDVGGSLKSASACKESGPGSFSLPRDYTSNIQGSSY
jgi:hypothetical protein